MTKENSLLDATKWIIGAWKAVKPKTILKRFEGVWFKVSNQYDGDDGSDGSGNHVDDEDEEVSLAVLVRELALQMA
ncbi:hypothetical protein DPMN_189232 [Dreissena polymorpha]|uniref:Uncharacterized protein n=1 Tax=Dreissena polymorpha TaxID=45954 RepID=A0A9D4I9A4_DREPO|nr:hypothetical protein DPMN_189232 [Dreissena polymorpha]